MSRQSVERAMRNRPRTDPYRVLGVLRSASDADVKIAYRELAWKFHPDTHTASSAADKAEAEARFKEIAEAYEVLSDRDKRAYFDEHGVEGEPREGAYRPSDAHGWTASRSEYSDRRRWREYSEYDDTPLFSPYTFIGKFNGIPHYHADGIRTCPLVGCPMRNADGTVRRLPSPKRRYA